MNRILTMLPEQDAKTLAATLKQEFSGRYDFSARPMPAETNQWAVMVKQPPSQKLLTFVKGAVAILDGDQLEE
jgi:hypothetical protein